MALTPSKMVDLGTLAPDFTLKEPGGNPVQLRLYAAQKPVLVMFICNHCPYVKHVRSQLAQLGRDYANKGVAIVAINSNDPVAYPEDSPEKMRLEKDREGYVFPYLFDETQSVAKQYGATCTPDFFLFDKSHHLVYRGQLDDSRPNSGMPVTGRDLREAMDSLLTGRAVQREQKPSMGCNIKWKA